MRARATGAHGFGATGRDTPWLDDSAGRMMRPYTASGGRTRPAVALDLLSLVTATGVRPRAPLGAEHTLALRLCAGAAAVTVAEVAGQLRLPAVVVKVLLADLMEHGAVMAQSPRFPGGGTGSFAADDQTLLRAVLDGLRKRL
ncbi:MULTISPECIES: DUF742 domain-containing protein [unclassified Streptomyces]|uniref:DUF742 domain-containing protein n=1 Tax=unclassified Streptomyces TaxID=2593676 RepID=UPI00225945EC|nr:MULTISPECIES: DUF742 domain-containing protein [unclassified Streptomyces]MCX4529028.1 DUF742 domain-containing protein [Streptomyces sp. NBC_01551]MCX4540289.1 DUF742 domain-containing protein [Streptomyces sp. NBC_01565]